MFDLLRRDRRGLALITLTLALLAVSSVSALASASKPVQVRDDSFSVKTLRIRRGTRIRWNWTGYLRHNVTVRSGPAKFHSRTQAIGTFSHVFRIKGRYTLYCTVHPFMKMTVIVR